MTDLRSHLAAGERAGRRYALGLPRLAPVGAYGGVLNQRAGSSQEFHEYREYQRQGGSGNQQVGFAR